jgi:hypothetical protein
MSSRPRQLSLLLQDPGAEGVPAAHGEGGGRLARQPVQGLQERAAVHEGGGVRLQTRRRHVRDPAQGVLHLRAARPVGERHDRHRMPGHAQGMHP